MAAPDGIKLHLFATDEFIEFTIKLLFGIIAISIVLAGLGILG